MNGNDAKSDENDGNIIVSSVSQSVGPMNMGKKFRQREQWASKAEFIFSCMAFSIGLGNVWRFPYLCFKNGGGAFLIPYFICLIVGGVPIYFLEVSIGQYFQNGGITVWEMICPLFKGIGYGTIIILFILNIYYIVILSWALLYLKYSFSWTLPWSTCNNSWNTPNCWSPLDKNVAFNYMEQHHRVDSVVEFWEREILQISEGVDHPDGLQWSLVITLFITWVMCFFCIWRGIKSTGKVVYFTALFPYVMLVILFIRGITLRGAGEGLIFYLKPDFSRLTDVQVWIDAGTQIFFSYAIAIGTMTALGSYNSFDNNFYFQLFFVCSMNCGTSFFAGFAIFSVLGFMAHEQGVPVAQVVDKGPGLAFIAYPKGVSVMPWSTVWAVLFFIMILCLGLGSQFVAVEGFVTSVVDMFPSYLRVGKRREYFIGGVCSISFLIGLSMVTRGGMYVFQLFDFYGASGICLLWYSFFECICIGWFYGVDRIGDNFREMIGFKPNRWFPICWKYLAPLLTMGIMLFSVFTLEPVKYNGIYVYPRWAILLGYALALCSILAFPIHVIYKFVTTPGANIKEKWDKLTVSSPSPYVVRIAQEAENKV